jgi:hypothetical protein
MPMREVDLLPRRVEDDQTFREVTDVGTEGSVGADVVAFVLDDVVVVVQPQSAQIVNLLLAKVAGAAGEVGCS